MNERQLKSLFWRALKSGQIKNNSLLPTPSDGAEVRIVEEAHFRSFDLLIASVAKEPCVEGDVAYGNMLARTQLLESFAKTAMCRIDCIRFYPVELKSDDDVLDERLPNQIINGILAFGQSVVVLDKNHSRRVKSGKLGRFLPATVICYDGERFEVVSEFDRMVSDGIFGLYKTSLARAVAGSDVPVGKVHSRLVALERLLQKLAFNQIYFENLALTGEELEFLKAIAGTRLPDSGRKRLSRLIKETANAKMTDYMMS
jgi:hypothetical protein